MRGLKSNSRSNYPQVSDGSEVGRRLQTRYYTVAPRKREIAKRTRARRGYEGSMGQREN